MTSTTWTLDSELPKVFQVLNFTHPEDFESKHGYWTMFSELGYRFGLNQVLPTFVTNFQLVGVLHTVCSFQSPSVIDTEAGDTEGDIVSTFPLTAVIRRGAWQMWQLIEMANSHSKNILKTVRFFSTFQTVNCDRSFPSAAFAEFDCKSCSRMASFQL